MTTPTDYKKLAEEALRINPRDVVMHHVTNLARAVLALDEVMAVARN